MYETQEFEEDIRKAVDVPPADEAFIQRLHDQVVQSAQTAPTRQTIPHTRRMRLAAGIGAALVIAVLVMAFTPAGQAFAQALQNFFRIVNVEDIPAPPEDYATPTYAPTFAAAVAPVTPEPTATPEPLPTGTNDPALAPCYDDPGSYSCQIARAEKTVGFDAKEFPATPEGFAFSGVRVYSDLISMEYLWIGGGAYLYLTQGIADEFQPVGGGPADAIEEVMVGENRGQFLAGTYIIKGDPPTVSWWGGGQYRLRWMEGNHWFEIQADYAMPFGKYNDRDYLIQMAENLVYDPEPEGIRAEFLTTMEDAAQLAGFTPLEPGILPENVHFDHGEYDQEHGTLRLEYYLPEEGIGGVTVWETPLDKVALYPQLDYLIAKGEEVEVNGYSGKYYSTDPYNHTIIWYTDELRIRVDVWASDLWYGGTFTQEQVLEIANSVK